LDDLLCGVAARAPRIDRPGLSVLAREVVHRLSETLDPRELDEVVQARADAADLAVPLEPDHREPARLGEELLLERLVRQTEHRRCRGTRATGRRRACCST